MGSFDTISQRGVRKPLPLGDRGATDTYRDAIDRRLPNPDQIAMSKEVSRAYDEVVRKYEPRILALMEDIQNTDEVTRSEMGPNDRPDLEAFERLDALRKEFREVLLEALQTALEPLGVRMNNENGKTIFLDPYTNDRYTVTVLNDGTLNYSANNEGEFKSVKIPWIVRNITDRATGVL